MLSIAFQTHVLANGLTVVLAPDRSVPVVAVNLWYAVGSRNEPPGRTGFAHLFEHMMFQGSANVEKGGHFELVERAGGSLNATTWFDRTNYFETVPSHQLDLALWLESDRMGWLLPAMTQEKLDNQIDVVRNERRQRYDNQPYGDWDERIQAMVYPPDHPYHHTVIGSMEDIGSATLEAVEEFFLTYYRPNNAVLTLAGDFEPEAALARVEHYFGGIDPGPDLPPLPGRADLPERIGEPVRERVEAEVPLPRTYLAVRIPSLTDPDFPVADVASSVLAEGRGSRLYRRLVRGERLANDVLAFAFPLTTGRSLMVGWVTGFPESDPDELEHAFERELEALSDVRDEEVERALALAETGLLRQVEQLSSRADLLSMYQTHFGDAGRLNGELDRLRGVTSGRIRAFAENLLAPDNRALLTYIPSEAS